MFRRLLIIPVLAIFAWTAQAQNENSIGAFASIPVGDFGATSLGDGGFAKTGWGVVFDSKSPLKFLPEGMRLYFHSTYQWNKIDSEKIGEAYSKAIGYRTEVGESRHSPITTMLGPSYDWNINDKFTIGLNGAIGILFNNTRAFGITVYDGNNNIITQEAVNFDNDPAFAYLLGAEAKVNVIENLMDLALYFDYTASKQNIHASLTTANVSSFEKLQFLNVGFKLVVKKQNPKP